MTVYEEQALALVVETTLDRGGVPEPETLQRLLTFQLAGSTRDAVERCLRVKEAWEDPVACFAARQAVQLFSYQLNVPH